MSSRTSASLLNRDMIEHELSLQGRQRWFRGEKMEGQPKSGRIIKRKQTCDDVSDDLMIRPAVPIRVTRITKSTNDMHFDVGLLRNLIPQRSGPLQPGENLFDLPGPLPIVYLTLQSSSLALALDPLLQTSCEACECGILSRNRCETSMSVRRDRWNKWNGLRCEV